MKKKMKLTSPCDKIILYTSYKKFGETI